MATLARYQFTAVNQHGEILPNATVEVRRESDNGLAALYSDRAGTVSIGNPFNSDVSTAYAAFHVTGGVYKITVTKDGFLLTYRYVGIGTASEVDIGTLVANKIDVFFILGQSNAAGSAHQTGTDIYGSPTPIPGTVLKWRSGSIQEGVDPTGGSSLGSMWPSFGMAMYNETGIKVFIVNVAIGASALIPTADTGGGDWSHTGTLRAPAFATCDAALAAIIAAGYTVNSKTVCWLQGENEASVYGGLSSPDKATMFTDYKTEKANLIDACITHFGTGTRFWEWELGTTNAGDAVGWVAIRQAQNDVMSLLAYRANPLVRIVSRAQKLFFNLAMMETGELHYTQEGYNLSGAIGATNGINGTDDTFIEIDGLFPTATNRKVTSSHVDIYGFDTYNGTVQDNGGLNIWGFGQVLAPDGGPALPTFSFINDPDNGLYRIGANNIGLAAGGSKIIDIKTTGITITGTFNATGIISASNGTAAVPAYNFTGDPDNGMYLPTTNTVSFACGGVLTVSFASSGITLLGSGVVTVPDGLVGTPAYSFVNDPDNGMYRSAVNTVAFAAGGSKIVEISAAGLDLNGTTGLTVRTPGSIQTTDGSIAVPGYNFLNDPDNGMYRIGVNNVGLVAGGVKILDITNVGMTIVGNLNLQSGSNNDRVLAADCSNATPTYSFFNDPDNGMYRIGTNNIALAAGGVKIIDMLSTGITLVGTLTLGGTVSGAGNQINNVVIGASNPLAISCTTLNGSGILTITDATEAGSATGSIVSSGGIYATKAIKSASTTDASSTTTGSGIFAGGIGVAKKAYFGDSIFIASSKGLDFGTADAKITHNVTISGSSYKLAFDASGNVSAWRTSATSGNAAMLDFYDGTDTLVGSIRSDTTGNTTAFNTSSDMRGPLKPNRELLSPNVAREIINRLEIWDFDKDGNIIRGVGVLAQDAYKVLPRMVSKGDDNPNLKPGDNGFQMWTAEKAYPVPYLIVCLQDSYKKIDALEHQNEDLERRVATLEKLVKL